MDRTVMDTRIKWLYVWFLKGIDIGIDNSNGVAPLYLIDPDKHIKWLIANLMKDYGNG